MSKTTRRENERVVRRFGADILASPGMQRERQFMQHGSVSVYAGAQLLALPLPGADAAWRYALLAGESRAAAEENGRPVALMTACEAPAWQERAGFILPPPQGVAVGSAYELTLVPAAGMDGRIAAFPCAVER